MADPILKVHGADATGTIWQEESGEWHATLLVRDLARNVQQQRGPDIFASEATARSWIIWEAAKHGFGPNDFDITVEEI